MIARVLISPDPESRVKEINNSLTSHLKGVNINSAPPNHPDLLYFEQSEKLGVEQAKQIRQFLSIKPYQAKGRVVVLEEAGNLTVEAQNALLKTLEEPPEETILLLGADSEDKFLPTILSRCEIITLQPERLQAKNAFTEDIQMLLGSTIADRFEYIEKLKDQRAKEEFLHALVIYFRNRLIHSSSDRGTFGTKDFLKELLQAEEWTKANVNMRGILEYLMLKMPNNTGR